VHRAVKTKGSPERSPEKRGIGPAHALNPILTIFGMWGGPLDVFPKFEFRVGRSPNFVATGGSKIAFFPIQDTSLIQQLVATAPAVILLSLFLLLTAAQNVFDGLGCTTAPTGNCVRSSHPLSGL